MSDNKEVLSIEDLPDDALLELFAFFDESSKIEATYVCERWHQLITSSSHLNKNFTLDLGIGFQALNTYKEFQNFNYSKVTLVQSMNFAFNPDHVLEMITYHKECLKEAQIWSSEWSFVSKVLMELKNLEKLKLSSIKFDENAVENISMPNLKELEIENNSLIVDAPNLVTLKYRCKFFPSELLAKYVNLTHLVYEAISYEAMSLDAVSPQTIDGISQDLVLLDVKVDENTSLISLLESQKDTLKELIMNSNQHGEVEFAVYEMKLEKLEIKLSEFISPPKDFKSSTIKELKLNGASDYPPVANLFRHCPQVEKLTLNINPTTNLVATQLASLLLQDLKCLVIYDALEIMNSSQNIELFCHLEVLKFEQFKTYDFAGSLSGCLKLLKKCPSLKKLHFNWESDYVDKAANESLLSDELGNFLSELPELEVLNTNYGFLLSEDNINCLSGSKIRTLKITVYEDLFEEQLKLAIQLSEQSDIRCTVFSMKRNNMVNSFDQLSTDDFDEYLYTCGNYKF